MNTDRRSKVKRVPGNPDEVLNKSQLLTLYKMEGFGWVLAFIRKPLFQDIVPVLFHPDNKKYGVLDVEGALNVQPDITLRQQLVQRTTP
ncbi:MAG: hypothetical protein R3308_04050 [Thiohalobacterales bacterium]|nr:hypothetical protein [Thiohalobacterales bacterium]